METKMTMFVLKLILTYKNDSYYFFFVIFVSILLIVVYLATRITSKLLNLIRPWAQNYVRTVLNREMLFADDHLRQT